MPKTNKELAVDVAIAYINSLHAKANFKHLDIKDTQDIIENVYKTLEKLDPDNSK